MGPLLSGVEGLGDLLCQAHLLHRWRAVARVSRKESPEIWPYIV
jgi:hypothetical protein